MNPSTIELLQQHVWPSIWALLGEEARRELEPKSMGDKMLHLIVRFAIDLEYCDWTITAKTMSPHTMRTVQTSLGYSDCDGHKAIEDKTELAILNLVAALYHEKQHLDALKGQ